MPKEKFIIGERVQVKCAHQQANGEIVEDWVDGVTVQADYRMVAVKFEIAVYASVGWKIPERILWCAHGSANIRRIIEEKKHD